MTHRSDLCCSDAAAVTLSDTVQVGFDGLYVGTGGDVTVKTAKGSTVTFPGVPSGAHLFVQCSLVKLTGTTASGIVGYIP